MAKPDNIEITKLLDGFQQVCKAKGIRLTHQRMEIFAQLAKYGGHPTAENIFIEVRRHLKTISLDTVYRTIAMFEKRGVLKRIYLLDNTARYDINLSVHHHLICTRCKIIEDFYWPNFDRIKLPGAVKEWGEIESKHTEIRGLCVKCKKALGK